ncbi:ArnT family glycosyltransferase [Paenarthrobacter histidinolovorans]|uniref:ArnT family glycosyltransferase n=1 Tax=Paenarthrobacter histidinolovorans TaxID=43664 RepID=UPI001E5E9F49|nr:phospholipid carrier-dependent glycosyltransferase [Paenarthrobacter histidinolovorans]
MTRVLESGPRNHLWVRLSESVGALLWLLWRPSSVTILLALLALLFRVYGVQQANDVFIDEVTYAEMARQMADGQLPSILGSPFFLHPPGSFALNAVFIRLFGLTGTSMDLALQLRWVNAVLGVLTVVVCVVVVRRLVGLAPAVFAGAILASDPFVLRMDGRLMMETPAGLAVLTGWLIVLQALGQSPGRRRVLLEVAGGLVFGLALVTKDMTVMFTVVPMLAAVLWRRSLQPLTAVRVIACTLVPYLVYLSVITSAGLLPDFVDQKAVGVLRITGAMQMTGFNSVTGTDLVGRLVELSDRFGTSYILLALSVVSGALAATSRVHIRRVVGLYSLISGLVGTYSVLFGAAEEQFGYCVVLAAVVSTPVAALMVLERRYSARRLLVSAAGLMTVVSLALGLQARLAVDDGLLRARDFLTTRLPPDSKVGLTTVTGEFALLPHESWEVAPSLKSLRAKGAEYVLTQGRQLREGYGFAAPELMEWLQANAEPVYSFTGATSGDTVVWRLDRSKLDAAVEAGHTIPPVTGGYP